MSYSSCGISGTIGSGCSCNYFDRGELARSGCGYGHSGQLTSSEICAYSPPLPSESWACSPPSRGYNEGEPYFSQSKPGRMPSLSEGDSYDSGREQTGAENNLMGFAGITFGKDQLIAFADSKGSIKDGHGNFVHDVDRGVVTKIFQNDRFICVTCDCPEFLDIPSSMAEGHEVFLRLDDWMGNNLKDGETITTFFGKMQAYFSEHAILGEDIEFLAAEKLLQSRPGYYSVTVSTDKHLRMDSHTEGRVPVRSAYIGNKMYVGLFDNTEGLKWRNTPESVKKALERIITFFDGNSEILPYNPVGLPVAVESVQL